MRAIPERIPATRKGSAVGFDEQGRTVTISFHPASKCWAVETCDDALGNAIPVESRRFPSKQQAQEYAAGILDHHQTVVKAWWNTSGLFT